MDYKKLYEIWKSDPYFDEKDRKELSEITDEKEIEDRFYKELEFGTGGLRGIMGIGSNRMNKYNIRKASNGFAQYLIDEYGEDAGQRGVAIAYDTRDNSKDFALEAALSFAAYRIPVYLFDYISATPLLSFAVRHLHCCGGVVVTASHNTKEYNGYKAYDENGCQLLLEPAEKVISYVNAIDVTEAIFMEEEKAKSLGLLKMIGKDVLDAYADAVIAASPSAEKSDIEKLNVVYTALHGSGNVSVRTVLEKAGYKLKIVQEQEQPDGNFPTVKSPNPGSEAALSMAMELGNAIDADIVVGSDPDADRAGVAIKHNGKLEFLDGNSMGALILYYLIERCDGQLPKGASFVTTIVSGELASDIARNNGIIVDKVLTGFKFIGEKMTQYKNSSDRSYLFGCEESYGFLGGDYVRDKCAAFAILTLCNACAYYKAKGKTLGDVMDDIHRKYGFYLDSLDSYVFKGKDGEDKMKNLTAGLRTIGSRLVPDVSEIKDYAIGTDGLPKSDVLKYFFNDGSWMCIRPSGTEPQIKVYYSTKGESQNAANAKYKERKALVDKYFEG